MKEHSPKVIVLPIAYKSTPKISKLEFLKAFYIFLYKINIVKSKEEFLDYVSNNLSEVNYYIEKIKSN